ncbi:N-acetyldiaminopimelate deacetylase [compost metagenome]
MGYPSLVNHEEEFERFYKVAGDLDGITPEISTKVMPAEDFSYYLQHVPGCFIFVGAASDEQRTSYPHHHPKFDIDEEAMLHGASLLIAMAESYQNQ